MTKKTKLELTWPGKEERPKLEPRILIEDPDKSYRAEGPGGAQWPDSRWKSDRDDYSLNVHDPVREDDEELTGKDSNSQELLYG
jgi:hypothetical protein